MRCLALAKGLVETGWRCGFAVAPGSADTVPALASSGFDIREAVTTSDMVQAWPDGATLAVVDHYDLGKDFENALQAWADKVMTIDDLADRTHACDLLLDSAAGEEDYAGLVPAYGRSLLGPDFALLRPEFRVSRLRRNRAGSPATPGKILVSLGGTDPDNRCVDVLRWLNGCNVPLAVTVVLGASNVDCKELEKELSAPRHILTVHRHVSDMAALLENTDLVIGAVGNSAWERCCIGVPSLLVVLAENQMRMADRLSKAGAATVISKLGGSAIECSVSVLEKLLEDAGALTEMERAAFGLCDGLGVNRAVCAIEAVTGRLPDRIALRRVRETDWEILLEWQRHPDTRRWALNPSVPSEADHRRWLDGKLNDPACLFHIVEDDDGPAGFIRLDWKQGAYVVSIAIAPDRRGTGLGKDVLTTIRTLLPTDRFLAEVLPGNHASQRLFRSCGYRQIDERTYVSDSLFREPGAASVTTVS